MIMKILTCVKAVPDLTMMPDHGWSVDEHFAIDTSYIKRILNCFDESAAELAIELGQQAHAHSQHCELDAITVGDSKSDIFLRTLLALEYQHTTRIALENVPSLNFSPEIIAKILAQYEKKTPHDLILLGMQSSDGNNAQTAQLLAEELGLPCLSNINHVELGKAPGQLTLYRSFENKDQVLQVKLPIVLAIGNTPNIYRLRTPTIKQKMAANKKTPAVLSLSDIEIDLETLFSFANKSLSTMRRQKNERKVRFIEGDSPQAIAHQIYHEAIKGRI